MSRTPHRSSGPARTIVIVLTCLALVATLFSASASAGVLVGGGYDGGYPYYGDPTPGDGTATLTISEPAELRGSVVIGYEVRYAAWTLTNFTYYQGCSTSAASVCVVPGLTKGLPYRFQVRAHVNPYLVTTPWSAWGTPTRAVYVLGFPDAPTSIAASPGATSLDVSWPAAESYGSPITGYTVDYSTDGTNWTTAPSCSGTSLSCTIHGLTSGTSYYTRVSATNAYGTSSTRAIDNPVQVGALNAPTGVTAAPGTSCINGESCIEVAWTAPTIDGGSAIDAYEVEYSSDGGATWTHGSYATLTTSAGVYGLSSGRSYQFRVRARNGIGWGPYSAVTETVPFVVPPMLGQVQPSGIVTTGGTVNLSGLGFLKGATVTIGGQPCANAVVGNEWGLTCVAPPMALGSYDVVITNPDGGSSTLSGGLSYVPGPIITSVGPPRLPLAGGRITIAGTGFSAGAMAFISNGVSGGLCSDVVVVSSTEITCTAPAHDAGVWSVGVMNPDFMSSMRSDALTYGTPAGAFTCSANDHFLMLRGQLHRGNPRTGWTAIGRRGVLSNALGFNPNDGYLYAVGAAAYSPTYHHLLRITSTGAIVDRGLITGLPDTAIVAGDVDPATGHLWVSGASGSIYVIDLSTRVATSVLTGQSGLGADLVIRNGSLVVKKGSALVSYPLTGDSLGTPRTTKVTTLAGLKSGAMWADGAPGGGVLLRDNSTGRVLAVSAANLAKATASTTVAATIAAPFSEPIDGATCTIPV